MIDWWNGLELAQQIFALVGIGSTVILVIQMAMMLFGLGDDSDADVDDVDAVDHQKAGVEQAAAQPGDGVSQRGTGQHTAAAQRALFLKAKQPAAGSVGDSSAEHKISSVMDRLVEWA